MSVEPNSNSCVKQCHKITYRVKWLKNKGAILIIIWSYLVTSVYHLLKSGHYKVSEVSSSGFILICTALLYPIGGWMADTHFGRYKVIHYSVWIMWTGAILVTLNDLLASVIATYEIHSETVYKALCGILAIGLAGFQSNIIQLGVDQLTDASATEITSFISWYVLTLYASGITVHYISDCIAEKYMFCVRPLVVAVGLTCALCSDYLFQHWLIKESVTGNPIRLICRVVKHAIRNRYLSYSEEELPSRFDVAKHRHGGPFTTQQVDNVRTFLWMLAIVSICSIVYGALTPVEYAKEKVVRRGYEWSTVNSYGILDCYKNQVSGYNDYFFAIAFVFLYEFAIHPFFYKYLPRVSIMTTFLCGTVFFFLLIISLLAIESIAYHNEIMLNHTAVCIFIDGPQASINHMWLFIPGFLSGLSSLLLLLSGFEFIWSQAPSTMKGMIFGLAYAFLGLYTLLHTAISSPFVFKEHVVRVPWEHAHLTCGVWYFIMEGVIILTILIVISVLVKQYKKKKLDMSSLMTYTSVD